MIDDNVQCGRGRAFDGEPDAGVGFLAYLPSAAVCLDYRRDVEGVVIW